MRFLIIIVILFTTMVLHGQEIECDGSFYLIVYTESEGKSRLYKVRAENSGFDYQEILLSEERRLTALNYNLTDKLLYAMDVDSYEVVNINRDGLISSLGVPENLDKSLEFSSGTFSPQSGGMLFAGFDPLFERDTKMYGLNIDRFYAGDLGVTGAFPVKITDLATDPLTGVIYGFNSLRATLMQTSISGGTTSYQYDAVSVSDIDALFFDQVGQLFGYSPSSGLYAIDKGSGTMESLGKEVEGTSADGCSCPYTFEFTKEISPDKIIPCEEFTVEYKFNNKMAIGQIVDEFRDTFPPGFEITNIETDLISTFSTVLDTEDNIIAIDLFIYLVGDNSITLTVKAPEGYVGEFGSNAIQSDFDLAFGKALKSDNPSTEIFGDPTRAIIINEEQIDFDDHLSYACDGLSAIISSPIHSESYQWSTGETDAAISVTEPGVYSLMVNNDCITYFDSIEISDFPEPLEFSLGEDLNLKLGDSIYLEIDERFSTLEHITWTIDGLDENCTNCNGVWIKPTQDITVEVNFTTMEGCEHQDAINIMTSLDRLVYLANAFTPNADGINDVFFIQTASPALIKEFKIYNRWGNLVFENYDIPTNDESEGWDGRLLGSTLNSNVYVYVADLIYLDGTEDIVSGEVLMLSK